MLSVQKKQVLEPDLPGQAGTIHKLSTLLHLEENLTKQSKRHRVAPLTTGEKIFSKLCLMICQKEQMGYKDKPFPRTIQTLSPWPFALASVLSLPEAAVGTGKGTGCSQTLHVPSHAQKYHPTHFSCTPQDGCGTTKASSRKAR